MSQTRQRSEFQLYPGLRNEGKPNALGDGTVDLRVRIFLRRDRAQNEGLLVIWKESPRTRKTEAGKEIWSWGDRRDTGDAKECAATPRCQ